jgi:hypothetical protein
VIKKKRKKRRAWSGAAATRTSFHSPSPTRSQGFQVFQAFQAFQDFSEILWVAGVSGVLVRGFGGLRASPSLTRSRHVVEGDWHYSPVDMIGLFELTMFSTCRFTRLRQPGCTHTHRVNLRRERDFFIDNLLVRIHLIIRMI